VEALSFIQRGLSPVQIYHNLVANPGAGGLSWTSLDYPAGTGFFAINFDIFFFGAAFFLK